MVFTGEVKSDFIKDVVVSIDKKPTEIDFAATDFLSIRDSLIDYIKAVYPLDYENFSESDLGVMLIEIVAYMGSVFSLKADMLANENYLRTAKLRRNVKKLLELIGVRMKGPISAAANAQITWPWTGGDPLAAGPMVITPENRVLTITSPEDGAALSFVLYKVLSNGQVDLANTTGEISLTKAESTGTAFNVHPASSLVLLEGSLVKQTGTFTSTELVKSISLSQFPVVEGSVSVYTDGEATEQGVFTEVDNLFSASGGSHMLFQTILDDNYKGTVLFGDNITGQSPSVGDTYTVTYRVGGGTRGNIKNALINASIIGSIGGTSYTGTLTNVSMGTGGADAETVEHAKRHAPMTFRRQDRLVTLPDYINFANTHISSYGSTGKATAVVREAFSSANIIDVYLLEKASNLQLRRATPEYKTSLLDAINVKKMLTDEVVVVDGLIRTLDLVVTVRVDKEFKREEPQIKALVRDVILNYFFVDNREFGQSFYTQDLIRQIHEIDKVRFATIENVPESITFEQNEISQLNNVTINLITI
jgi:hypothetical protein